MLSNKVLYYIIIFVLFNISIERSYKYAHLFTYWSLFKRNNFDIIQNKVVKVNFLGGCDGNLKGLSSLIEGMDVDEAIKRLQGITCGSKNTSCPDQLSKALQEAKKIK